MKLLDKIWNILGLVEPEDAEETSNGNSSAASDKPTPRLERKSERPPKPYEDHKHRRSSPAESSVSAPNPSLPAKSVTPVPAVVTLPPSSSPTGKGKVVVTQPMGFDDARQIAENVTNGKTVIVNFERTDGETTKRTVDFMSGITYAVGGTVQRISSTIFLFAPAQVEVFSSERFTDDEQRMLPWR